jgi:sugar phosphate isomerase/epimerase
MATPDYGIFARVFPTGAAAEVAASIHEAGYSLAQLNLRAIGLPTIPKPSDWPAIDPAAIRADLESAGVRTWGVSCSYNMAHPDAEVRRAGTTAAVELIARAPEFGATAVTLCTGSRNPEKMWAFHPNNATPAAWDDMRAEMDRLVVAARAAGVVLGVEPEIGNVVCDADAAARLYSELGADGRWVGIVADSANLLTGRAPESHAAVLEHAFTSLGDRIICLHAKDLVPWAETLAGRGVGDYRLVGELYRRLGLTVPLIVQDVLPEQAAPVLALMRSRFER